MIIRVSDQGRGIPSDVLDKIFDRFATHTVGSRHRGVGLGLSIVRSFVELHGGKVKIDSAPHKGTSITCIFPTHMPEKEQLSASAAQGIAQTQSARLHQPSHLPPHKRSAS